MKSPTPPKEVVSPEGQARAEALVAFLRAHMGTLASLRALRIDADIKGVNTLTEWTRLGKRPRLDVLEKLARSVNQPVSALVAAYYSEPVLPAEPPEETMRRVVREEVGRISAMTLRAALGERRAAESLTRLRAELDAAELALLGLGQEEEDGLQGEPGPDEQPHGPQR